MQLNQITRTAVRVGVAALLVSPVKLSAQCAMCWQALANSAEGAALIRGFDDGILFLLAVPFLVVGTIGFRIYQAQRRPVLEDGSREPGFAPSTQTKTFPIFPKA